MLGSKNDDIKIQENKEGEIDKDNDSDEGRYTNEMELIINGYYGEFNKETHTAKKV